MRNRIFALVALTMALAPARTRGDDWCGPDLISVSAFADSIYVSHRNALKENCLVLGVSGVQEAQVIRFYERDDGRPCPPFCCFDHLYGAAGIAPGRYTVQVYDEIGSRLYGEQEVDVAGPGGSFDVFVITAGDPVCVEPVKETTWGRVRLLYE